MRGGRDYRAGCAADVHFWSDSGLGGQTRSRLNAPDGIGRYGQRRFVARSEVIENSRCRIQVTAITWLGYFVYYAFCYMLLHDALSSEL